MSHQWITALFSGYACCHYYLAIYQFDYMESLPNHHMITYPILLTALGGAWDNMRLACGAYWGKRAAPDFSAHVSFFLHMAVLPSLLSTYSHMLSSMLDIGWLQYPGTILAILFCVHGLRSYFSDVHGNLELVEEYGVARWRFPPSKKDGFYLLPVFLVGFGGVMVGLTTWWVTGKFHFLYQQLLCFFGQAFVPFYKQYGFFASNAFEVLFLYSLMSVQSHIPGALVINS